MNYLKKLLFFEPKSDTKAFSLSEENSCIEYDIRNEEQPTENVLVSSDIEVNEAYIRKRLSIPLNNDFVLRKIRMKENRRAFIIFIEGMVNTQYLNDGVIEPLLKMPYIRTDESYSFEDVINECFIAHAQATFKDNMDDVCEEINFGGAAVFVNGFNKAFVLDIRTWSTRAISKPENEQSIYGPQEAFAEMLRSNTALVRKIIKTEKLIAEGVKIGNISKTRGVLLYINDIANEQLVNEVRHRINSISMDYVIAIEEVELMMEEKSLIPTSLVLETERPDVVAKALTEGRVALILNGSPRALIFPTSLFELSHSVSDQYLRLPYANMTRILHIFAAFASVLLPGLYLATTLFHQELIPTYLLYSISAARENVPFPSVLELVLMDIAFEMVREAGIRMPGSIGSTLGIVGGLILGQAAVSAKIVSPLMIIIIAITGIGSFAISDYSLGWGYRILRLIFIGLGSTLGFYGIALGIVIYAIYLGAQTSFGVPYLSPLPKRKSRFNETAFFVNPIWKQENRPDFLKTKKKRSEPKISRKWKQ